MDFPDRKAALLAQLRCPVTSWEDRKTDVRSTIRGLWRGRALWVPDEGSVSRDLADGTTDMRGELKTAAVGQAPRLAGWPNERVRTSSLPSMLRWSAGSRSFSVRFGSEPRRSGWTRHSPRMRFARPCQPDRPVPLGVLLVRHRLDVLAGRRSGRFVRRRCWQRCFRAACSCRWRACCSTVGSRSRPGCSLPAVRFS